MLTQEALKEEFDYRDGKLFRKIKRPNSQIGKEAGTPAEVREGIFYKYNWFKGTFYRTHRLIYMWHHGFMPKIIDHIDGDTLNNNIENLRSVTLGQNRQNSKINKNNKTGHKGICIMQVKYKNKVYEYYRVDIASDKVNRVFKTFKNLDDAIKFSIKTRMCLHGEYARYV